MSSTHPQSLPPSVLTALRSYTACDISDALSALKVPGAGFLPDLGLISKTPDSSPSIVIAPASTIQFIPKHAWEDYFPSNIPRGVHWSDLAVPGTILVMSQPQDQSCAVLGGINAARLKRLGALGVVVHGRVRDVEQLKAGGMTIWASGTSTVGTGLQSTAHDVQVSIDISVANNPPTFVKVSPGDIVFADSANGVVIIPRGKLEEVLQILPGLVEADARCLRAVEDEGMPVSEAFKTFRGK